MPVKRNHIILCLAIVLSVVIRIPNLNRPLSKHHEFITAHVLRVLQIWDEGGIANYHYAPVMNYAGANNKYISNQDMVFFDAHGDYYYLSYPPFNFILPYAVFHALHISISPLALQLFNIFIHILSALLLYRIVLLLIKDGRRELVATIATALFLINPCSLWFFGNVYFADMLVIFFWLAAIFLLLLMKDEKKFYLKLFLLAIAIILGNYTEYLMLMFSGCAVLYVFTTDYRRKWIIAPVIVVSVLIPYLVTIYQYSQVGGFEALVHQSVMRYKARSGYHYPNIFLAFISQSWIILQNYLIHYIAFIIVLTGFLILRFTLWRTVYDSAFSDWNKQLFQKSILFLMIIPIVLHHLIFLNASMHDFQVLKSSIPLCILVAVPVSFYFPRYATWIAVAVLAINVFDYYYINQTGPISRNGDEYAADYKIGRAIKENSSDDEVIFINTDVSPQVVYYANRNIFRFATKENATEFLRQHHFSKGALFHFGDSIDYSEKPYKLVRIEHITP